MICKKLDRRMIQTAALCLLLIPASWTKAQTVRFPANRDVGINGWGVPETFTNTGANERVRGAKLTQHAALFDWNTDEINAYVADNVRDTDELLWTFNIFPHDTPGSDVEIETVESLNDWAEGDAFTGCCTEWAWTQGTPAATHEFAQTFFLPGGVPGNAQVDLATSLPWTNDEDGSEYTFMNRGGGGTAMPNFTNSQPFSLATWQTNAFISAELDGDLVADLIGNEANRGLRLAARGSGSNWSVSMREDGQNGAFIELTILRAIELDGNGATYSENFDSMGTRTGEVVPFGWTIDTGDGPEREITTLGLVDGPLTSPGFEVVGPANVGGNAAVFASTDPARLATWKTDLTGDDFLDQQDVIADDAQDRAFGISRVAESDPGTIAFSTGIINQSLKALVVDWDLEIWGGDPEAAFRGSEGGGFAAEVRVGGNLYHSETQNLFPGDTFDTNFDGAGGNVSDATLIDGNVHAIRNITTGIIEIDGADGAVGNRVELSFNSDFGNGDEGWIPAIDNVRVRALAAGDAQGDGDVDPSDLIQLLAGGAFGQGNIDATWAQGDFDNDGDFDGFDVLAIVQGLAGEFPKTYAHDPNNDVPDVLINPATGNITFDTNGIEIGSIVMDSAAGIFNGPNSPSWDAPGDFAADIDTQISMPISFTNPGYTGVDDLGDGIIGNLAPGFDILADLTIKYLDPNGDLLDAEAHIVPEPSSFALTAFGLLGMLAFLRRHIHESWSVVE